ncbi:MAG: PD-(D/E)XK nuclease-like domain-containing protein [Mycetocola sp.]
MPEVEYHAHPALSSTGARDLLKSPALFRYRQTSARKDTAAFDLGSAVHARVLGAGWDVVELDFPDWRTKAARDARDAVRAEGGIPQLVKDMRPVHGMVEAVLMHEDAARLLAVPSRREASVFGQSSEGVEVRARFDILTDQPVGIDLKTTLDASPHGFGKSVGAYRYDIQAGHYADTYKFSEGVELDSFKFIAVEKTAPYLVAVYTLNPYSLHVGRDYARRARELYAEATATGVWSGYVGDTDIDAPAWVHFQHDDDFGNGTEMEIR